MQLQCKQRIDLRTDGLFTFWWMFKSCCTRTWQAKSRESMKIMKMQMMTRLSHSVSFYPFSHTYAFSSPCPVGSPGILRFLVSCLSSWLLFTILFRGQLPLSNRKHNSSIESFVINKHYIIQRLRIARPKCRKQFQTRLVVWVTKS